MGPDLPIQLDQLAIVGTGLLGSSVARAARARGVTRRIVGIDRSAVHRDRALRLGIVDEASTELSHAATAEVVVFCTPVDVIAAQVLALAPACGAGTLLTDVGSTKGEIVAAVESALPTGVCFVGGHPLAGSEKGGPDHAGAHLFEGRLTILTRTARTDPVALERATAFWQALGARVRVMTPDEHDRALAVTSHLPHLAAAALAGLLPPELYELTATGFRDTTRLAESDPPLWSAICRQNRPALLQALELFLGRLENFRNALATDDAEALLALLAQGKKIKQDLAGGNEER
ncbi:MAG: prephenate dehydrogenase/arogenate dehydrogenase family protein [Planctomycetes bacterium]|nr:prephenate dehydrogenase/arogenate dehydrogenase family protein [Planctomycetota bacterium]